MRQPGMGHERLILPVCVHYSQTAQQHAIHPTLVGATNSKLSASRSLDQLWIWTPVTTA